MWKTSKNGNQNVLILLKKEITVIAGILPERLYGSIKRRYFKARFYA